MPMYKAEKSLVWMPFSSMPSLVPKRLFRGTSQPVIRMLASVTAGRQLSSVVAILYLCSELSISRTSTHTHAKNGQKDSENG